MGRFINADSYSSTGQGFLGYNMFAYCQNNPVNCFDPTGQWIIADGLEWLWANVVEPVAEWVSEEIIEPVVTWVEDAFSGLDGTLTVGFNLSGSFGFWDYNYQIGISLDFKGNITIQSTKVTGLTTGDPYVSVGVYAMITNAPTTHDINGMGYQFGGTAGIPSQEGLTASIGAEFNVIDTGNGYYYGATGMLGITTTPGREFHAEFGSTHEVCSFNIFHAIHSLIQ